MAGHATHMPVLGVFLLYGLSSTDFNFENLLMEGTEMDTGSAPSLGGSSNSLNDLLEGSAKLEED
eukprot:8546309-Lingulodinium_polyedra.AAC.1